MLDCPKPIIDSANDDAFGFGPQLRWCAMCDLRTRGWATDPHVRVGMAAGDGGAFIWPQLVGYSKGKHYLLTGKPIAPPEAEATNLITICVAPARFYERVRTYATRLARGAQSAIHLFATAYVAAYEGLTPETDDFREGVSSLLEKRRPNSKGR